MALGYGDRVCPGCDAPEACYHEHGCTAVGIGVRPCCRSRVYLDHFEPHERTCPEWGAYHPAPFDMSGDPWRGLIFAREG